ncbi:hypothetical protein EPO05_05920 [Patescibacteria group bacterium]|nr:MAG: hypothetical protein EPO05_05920 [Patescibacteria group bacterium]
MGKRMIENAVLDCAFGRNPQGRVIQPTIVRRILKTPAAILSRTRANRSTVERLVDEVLRSLVEQGQLSSDEGLYGLTREGAERVKSFRKGPFGRKS